MHQPAFADFIRLGLESCSEHINKGTAWKKGVARVLYCTTHIKRNNKLNYASISDVPHQKNIYGVTIKHVRLTYNQSHAYN